MSSSGTRSTHVADLVEASQRVAEHSGRRAKVARIADFLRDLAPDEIGIGVSYLAGVIPQRRSGIGYALIRDSLPTEAAAQSTLTLRAVDGVLSEIAGVSGPGALAQRKRSGLIGPQCVDCGGRNHHRGRNRAARL